MNSNLKRRIKKAERALGTGCDDSRAYSYPNNFAELAMMATWAGNGEEQRIRRFLRKRRSKPCPVFWDWIDQETEQLKKGEVKNRTDTYHAEHM